MTVDLGTIKALTFDVGGTIFDWHHTIRDEVARLAAQRGAELDAAAFTNAWRFGMFEELAKVRSGELPWMNADQLHRRILDRVAGDYPQLALSPAGLDNLNRVWHRLAAWPDAPAVIEQLRSRYTVVVLTVLNWSLVVDSSKHNGISWDGILSCEFLGHYKPDEEAYLAGVRMLGLEPGQVMMVAAHAWDLQAARNAGLRTAYVPRPLERGAGGPPAPPMEGADVTAEDFPDLARKLAG